MLPITFVALGLAGLMLLSIGPATGGSLREECFLRFCQSNPALREKFCGGVCSGAAVANLCAQHWLGLDDAARRAGMTPVCFKLETGVIEHAGYNVSTAHRMAGEHVSYVDLRQSAARSATKRNLLYLTTACSSLHKVYLNKCWPDAVARSPMLKNADVLLYAGCGKATSSREAPTDRAEAPGWQSLEADLRAMPNANVSIVYAKNPGYGAGAVQAIIDGIFYGWFDQYDWVIRVNPDTLIIDDYQLAKRMRNPAKSYVLADCGKGLSGMRVYAKHMVHTDFFAARSDQLDTTLAGWMTGPVKNAELLATNAFAPGIRAGLATWLLSGNNGVHCRMSSFSGVGRGSGIEHWHPARHGHCMMSPATPGLYGREAHYWNDMCGDACVGCTVRGGARPANAAPCTIYTGEPESPVRLPAANYTQVTIMALTGGYDGWLDYCKLSPQNPYCQRDNIK